jgi:hypothetical protein
MQRTLSSALLYLSPSELSHPGCLACDRTFSVRTFTLIQYLEQEYGWNTVLNFLEPGSTFKSVTGKGKRDVFEDWKQWLESV